MTLGEAQSKFTRLIGVLIYQAFLRGYELTFGEGKVYERRKSYLGLPFVDGMHMKGSLHYEGLAMDLNLFVNGEWVQEGAHPAWKELGGFWKSLDPSCAWGGDFLDKKGRRVWDSNHFSYMWEGRK